MGRVVACPVRDDPPQVADTVLDAVQTGRLWILTHPESEESIRTRAEAIVGDGIPPGSRMGQ